MPTTSFTPNDTSDDARSHRVKLRAVPGYRLDAAPDGEPRMKIALIGINYAPETTGIAPYTAGLARGLAARGHDVEVMAGQPHYPQWQRLPGYGQFRSTEEIDGVRVRRFRHYVPRRQSTRRRALMELTFGSQAASSRWNKPDVVICVTPPLIASALCAARLRFGHGAGLGVPFTRRVQPGDNRDRSPRGSIVVCGPSTRTSSPGARRVVVIQRDSAATLPNLLNVDKQRIREIRNWTHVSRALARGKRRISPPPWVGARDDIVVLHAGNMGLKQGLDNVIDAARLARSDTSAVKFVLLGDGHQRGRLEQAARGVSNLEIVDPVSEQGFPAALGAADVLLVNELPGVAHMAMPSKLTSYFQAGKRSSLRPTQAGSPPRRSRCREPVSGCPPAVRTCCSLRRCVWGPTANSQRNSARLADMYSDKVLSAGAALDRYEQWILDLAGSRVTAAGDGVTSRRALITGITGQDGSYLAELLLGKGYEVHGLIRRVLDVQHVADRPPLPDPHDAGRPAVPALRRPHRRRPAGHAAARDRARRGLQPRRAVPRPGQLRRARAHRRHDRPRHHAAARGGPACRASSAASTRRRARRCSARRRRRRTRTTPFYPRSPYGAAKVYAYWVDPELPRGLRHVRGQRHPVQPRVAPPRRDVRDPQDHPRGRPDQGRARRTTSTWATSTPIRDWGYAPEYVEGMWRMLQADEPDDYVLATGRRITVRDFLDARLRARRARLGEARPVRRALPAPDRGRRADRRRGQGRAKLGWKPTVDCPSWRGSWSTPTSRE